jgi:hypothetical protein
MFNIVNMRSHSWTPRTVIIFVLFLHTSFVHRIQHSEAKHCWSILILLSHHYVVNVMAFQKCSHKCIHFSSRGVCSVCRSPPGVTTLLCLNHKVRRCVMSKIAFLLHPYYGGGWCSRKALHSYFGGAPF